MKFDDNNFDEKEKLNNENKENETKNRIRKQKESKTILFYFIYLIIISIVLGLTILIIILLIDKIDFSSNSYVKSDFIMKGKSDYRKYRVLHLKNGLEAVIISDQLSVKAGASLSVRVGANNDPDALLGLAHFCEHMLFLGSVKYPQGDDYFKTITENNGHFNAYTDREITNYFFDIHYNSFDKAIDIFSRFFIDPIFTAEKLDKEINAVNSEYEKNLILDSRKRSQVFSDLIEKDNPFHRFTTGNIQSLVKSAEKLGLNLRDELLRFHKKYYVSDKMKLIIYSNDDIDDIEEMIVEKFSEIKPSAEFNIEMMKNKNNKDDSNFFKNVKNLTQVNNWETFLNINKINNSFVNPFHSDILGSLVMFNSITMEHEIEIIFIQKSLSDYNYFSSNPYYYFSLIFENKDENSLINILKTKKLATELSADTEKDFLQWSDFTINIKLTENGINNLQEVLGIINDFLTHMKNNFISESYYSYLQKINKLKLEYNKMHTELIYQLVSKLGARAQKYPIKYILDEIHLINSFNYTNLSEYAEGLRLDNSLIFLPNKSVKEIQYAFLINETKKSNYEPWYKTNYTFSKINLDVIKSNRNPINFSDIFVLKPIYEDYLSTLTNDTIFCNNKCIEQLKKFSISDPLLLNKTNKYEFWYKRQTTLDFKKSIIQLQFQYQKKTIEEKFPILILTAILKKRLKKLKTKLYLLSNSINVDINNFGIKVTYSSFQENMKESTREFIDNVQSIFNNKDLSDFNEIMQELKDDLLSDYNAQPCVLAYEYLQKNAFNNFITSEEYLKFLPNVTQEDFIRFVNDFKGQYYMKLLLIGDIQETVARQLFSEFNPMLDADSISTSEKKSPFSLKGKNKNKRSVLNYFSGNFLIRKEYHQKTNRNNALVKCYKIGRKEYKIELLVKLFNSIIGNIVFRELRTNKQFGYIAKSKVEIFDTYYFYCIHVQGSSKLPHVIDEAAIELLETAIKQKLETLSPVEFNSAKRKNFDMMADVRFDLSQVSEREFNHILVNNYNFPHFNKIDTYSKSILKKDILNFFIQKFLGNSNLKFTVYMYSQQVDKKKLKLKAQKGEEYQELE